MPLADWLARLESFSPHEIDLGLERTLAVLDRLDLSMPQTVLHIAGTNGKGSSVAIAEAILSGGDNTIGSYTSPHIFQFNERIRVDGNAVDDAAIVAAFERVEAARGDTPLTYFEFATLAAMVVFESRHVDIAILEVGMGGRLDAVNAIEPTAGLITNVSLDHCAWLGEDAEAIAAEKAGIMREGKTVVFASGDVPSAIPELARINRAELVLAGRDYAWQADDRAWRFEAGTLVLDDLRLPALTGAHQVGNAAGVVALLQAAGFTDRLTVDRINTALEAVHLDGRMQVVERQRRWLFDVAHNPAAAEVLARTLQSAPFPGNSVVITGLLDDKDVEGVVEPLAPVTDYWIAITAASERAIDAAELARRIANATNKACMIAPSIDEALAHARRLTDTGDRIIVTGSFYVVGPLLEVLGLYSPGLGES